MKRLICTLALVFALPAAGGDDHTALRTLLDEFLAGASVNDAAMHERFWADDLVYTSSSGERFGKAEIMAELTAAGDTDDPAEPEGPEYSAKDVAIRAFGEVAIVTFRLVAEQDGQPTSEYFNTGVFHQRQDQWRAVAWHATIAATDR